jgi:glycosyltransferase involved in cell wall biosynthesis
MINAAVIDETRTAWAAEADWSVIVPFHNERDFLPATLASLAAQRVRPVVVLVDNASTDRSGELARDLCLWLGLDAVHLHESRPGKVAALQCGLEAVTTRFVATCDADTLYPEHYLARATRMLEKRGAVAGVAAYSAPSARLTARLAGWRMVLTSRLLPQQCLNGGAGQVFRTAALRACGGFDPAIWNWVLEDHEIMARIEPLGRIAYDARFVCHPAPRPRAVNCTGWTFGEQLRYHSTRAGERLAYFHEFLGPRLRSRALQSAMLRRSVSVTAGA